MDFGAMQGLQWSWRVLRFFLAVIACTIAAAPAFSDTVDVVVEVGGIRSASGRVLVALHDDRRAFPSRWDKAVALANVAAEAGTTVVPLRLPRAGRFALIVVHDEDGDGRMKKTALGLPREGFATGRNAQALEFPFFEPALRDWQPGTQVSVRLLYP